MSHSLPYCRLEIVRHLSDGDLILEVDENACPIGWWSGPRRSRFGLLAAAATSHPPTRSLTPPSTRQAQSETFLASSYRVSLAYHSHLLLLLHQV
jgi:hypothetical protein